MEQPGKSESFDLTVLILFPVPTFVSYNCLLTSSELMLSVRLHLDMEKLSGKE
ncbi:hypothetical protein LY78DRAFT_662151 [Colletotrichum sublineola]|nr:hypothetical protein LY78DRAFT_662151 [Colletotrichum sublineola]